MLALDARGRNLGWNDWIKAQSEKFPQFKEIFQWVKDVGNGLRPPVPQGVELDPWMQVIQEYGSTPKPS